MIYYQGYRILSSIMKKFFQRHTYSQSISMYTYVWAILVQTFLHRVTNRGSPNLVVGWTSGPTLPVTRVPWTTSWARTIMTKIIKGERQSEPKKQVQTTCCMYLPTFLPSYLPTFLPSYLPSYLPTYLPTFLPSYLPTYTYYKEWPMCSK